MTKPMLRGLIALAFAAALSCTQEAKSPPYTPGFGEIMTFVQARHAKLWFAGQAGNWALAGYEIDELKEAFDDVKTYHPVHEGSNLPTADLLNKIMAPRVAAVDDAIKAHDAARFTAAFDTLTAGCNQCHQTLNFGFNVITRPTANPYTNQVFTPK